jgi:hypothetical protein
VSIGNGPVGTVPLELTTPPLDVPAPAAPLDVDVSPAFEPPPEDEAAPLDVPVPATVLPAPGPVLLEPLEPCTLPEPFGAAASPSGVAVDPLPAGELQPTARPIATTAHPAAHLEACPLRMRTLLRSG